MFSFRNHLRLPRRTCKVANENSYDGETPILTEMKKYSEVPGPRFSWLSWSMLALFSIVLFLEAAFAQSPGVTDLLRRQFVTKNLAVKSFGPVHWIGKGQFYTVLEPSGKDKGLTEIVRYETASSRREVLVSGSQLVPPGSDKPLEIEDYSLSDNLNRVLIFTNSRRVWRQNTRGDYWVLDRETGALRKLGDGGPPSSLMFAKFSPDGSKVAYVRFNNIYVEDLRKGVATRLTFDGGEKMLNGTTDWVYEE